MVRLQPAHEPVKLKVADFHRHLRRDPRAGPFGLQQFVQPRK